MTGERDEPPDSEAKTPNNTGSFAVFHDAAIELAEKLRRVAEFKEKVLPALDIAGARKARLARLDLIELAGQFAAWPTAPAEQVAVERPVLVPRLMEFQRFAEETAAATPGFPAAPIKYGRRPPGS